MDLSIVIPCYNESEAVTRMERELAPVVNQLSEHQTVEVIFVDDGSVDETWDRLTTVFGAWKQPRLTVRFERHKKNRGVGAAQRTGFVASQGAVVVTTDSDGTYKFSEIPRLLDCLKGGVDIVTASPYHPDGGIEGVPAHRLILSRGASVLYRLLVSWRVYTYTSMFRAYRRKVIDQVTFESDGFLSCAEILVNGMLAGFKVVEYPSVLHTRAVGTSKAKLASIVRAHLKFQRALILRRLGLRN